MPRQRSDGHATFQQRSRFALAFALLLVCLTQAHVILAQQSSTSKAARLSKIEWVGLERLKEEEAKTASGLQLGQPVDVKTLDAASQRLLDSGLFRKLNYRYRTTNGQAIVTFIVEEAKGSVPVVFDNFVWFTTAELVSAISRDLPGFNGTAPESGNATTQISKSLERLLRERNIGGQVEYTPSADASGRNARHVFAVKGVPIPVCSLRFPGASGVTESELAKASKFLLSNDYSREFVAGFATSNLLPLYRRQGHLRAQFLEPQAVPESGGDCKGGVTVTIPVNEGPVYSWNKAEWEGNGVLTASDLDDALGMKPGEVANGIKFDEGLEAVRETYGKRGFITAKLSARPEFDDANRRLTYRIEVKEGPLYRMGSVIVSGIPEEDAEVLKSKWTLKTGETYDTSYLKEFLKKTMPQLRIPLNVARKTLQTLERPNRQNSTVDILFTFK